MKTGFGKIAIVGSGAIGLFFGGCWARRGADVTFLLRSDFDEVARNGITLDLPDGTVHLPQPRIARTTEEIGPVDLVVVALKATSNAALPALVAPLVKAGTVLFTLQNGLGNEEWLARHFPGHTVLGGLCFIGMNRIGPGRVLNKRPGYVLVGRHGGPADENVRAAAALLADGGTRSETTDDLVEARWKKLAWNIPFNGLTIAAGGITTDRIMADPALHEEARQLMLEVAAAARAEGRVISQEFLDYELERTVDMGPYRPSSLLDFAAGQPVEVEPIWGEPLRRAQAAGVCAPRLAMLYALLAQLTRR